MENHREPLLTWTTPRLQGLRCYVFGYNTVVLGSVFKIAHAALGAPGKVGKEGDEDGGGPTIKEPDAAYRRPPPQPFGTRPGGRPTASAALNNGSTLSCGRFLVDASRLDSSRRAGL